MAEENSSGSTAPAASGDKWNVMAIIGFILAFIFPLIGLILSIVALIQFKKNPNQKGKGLAIAGIIISAVLMLVGTAYMIYSMVVIGSAVNAIGTGLGDAIVP